MKAQRTCLIRAKNLMALNFYSFIWRYIRHKMRIRRDKLRRHSAHMPTKCVAPYIAWEQRVMQSYAYNAPDTQHALYSANNYATTIRYSLYNVPWLPWQLSDCGCQNRDPANPKSSRSTYTKSVFIRWHSHLRKTREKNALYYIEQRPLTAEAGS